MVGTTRTSAGHYNITFSGNVGLCARWVNTTVADRTFAVGHLGNPQIMAVTVHDLTGASVDTTFTLNISCPRSQETSVGRWPGFDPGHPAAAAYGAGSAEPFGRHPPDQLRARADAELGVEPFRRWYSTVFGLRKRVAAASKRVVRPSTSSRADLELLRGERAARGPAAAPVHTVSPVARRSASGPLGPPSSPRVLEVVE